MTGFHDLNKVLKISIRSSVLGHAVYSVWITTDGLESCLSEEKWQRQGLCIGDGLTLEEAERWVDDACKQLNVKKYCNFAGDGI